MGRSSSYLPALRLYLALNAAALFIAAGVIALLARSSGFSIPRVILTAATLILAFAVAAAALHLHIRPARERGLAREISSPRPRLAIALAAVFLAFWCLTWYPPQYAGDAYYYLLALYPLILCGLFASGCALLVIGASRLESFHGPRRIEFREHHAL